MKKKFLALHVVLPIIVGGLVYICWRDPALLMFKWFRALGVEPLVLQLRVAAAATEPGLPRWLIYSLPDGLWVYAFTAFMAHAWSESPSSPVKTFWLSLGVVLGAGSELGQLVHIVPGTFDWIDFICYVSAGALSLFFASRYNFKRSLNERPTKTNAAFAVGSGGFSGAGIRQRVLDE
jgi:hypothetical protein